MGSDVSWMSYENDDNSSSLPSLMHNLGEFEFNECWARCCENRGTNYRRSKSRLASRGTSRCNFFFNRLIFYG